MEAEIDAGSLWAHIRRAIGKVPFVFDVAALYLCMCDDATPEPIQAVIAAALAYFIMPADAIPDFTPLYGWLDDGAVVAATLALVREHITDEHRQRARAFLTGGAVE